MHYQITVRYGGSRQRYHTLAIEAPDAPAALRATADQMPPEIAPDVDLVELRIAIDSEDRSYLGGDEEER
jgi:hypothetical protein